jgi:uncharacterized LabA/DUF88 family protein
MAVFIDGRNVHYGLRDLRFPLHYDVLAFAAMISVHHDLRAVYYYNAPPLQKYCPEPGYGEQLRYYAHIEAQPLISFRKGYLSDAGPKPVEKLVDVMLALDLALGAIRDEYDVAALVSADADFEPAVLEARAAGKAIINYVFRHKQSFKLARCCSEVRYLKSRHFVRAST